MTPRRKIVTCPGCDLMQGVGDRLFMASHYVCPGCANFYYARYAGTETGAWFPASAAHTALAKARWVTT